MTSLSAKIKKWKKENDDYITSNIDRFIGLKRLNPDSATEDIYNSWKKRLRNNIAVDTKKKKLEKEAGILKDYEKAVKQGYQGRLFNVTQEKLDAFNEKYKTKQEKKQEKEKVKVNKQYNKKRREFRSKVQKYTNIQPAKKLKCSVEKIDGFDYTSHTDYLDDMYVTFYDILKTKLAQFNAIKFQLYIEVKLIKTTGTYEDEDGKLQAEVQEQVSTFSTKNKTITNVDEIESNLREAITELIEKIDKHSNNGSGWVVSNVLLSKVITYKFQPLKGSSYIPLPDNISNKKCCINVKNDDNECFRWAILSCLFPAESHTDRLSNYRKYRDEVNLEGIEFPVKIDSIDKVEQLNPSLKINVYYLIKNNGNTYEVAPFRTSKKQEGTDIDLLLIYDKDYYEVKDDNEKEEEEEEGEIKVNIQEEKSSSVNSHYVWIKNLEGLVRNQLTKHKEKLYICRRCFYHTHNVNTYINHVESQYCSKYDEGITSLPDEEHAKMSFDKFKSLLPSPYFIVADFEAILEPVMDINTNEMKTKDGIIIDSKTIKETRHTVCSYGFKVVCTFDSTQSIEYQHFTGQDADKKFIEHIRRVTYSIYDKVTSRNIPMKLTEDDKNSFKKADCCWICRQDFTEDNTKVKDHDHMTGTYRGAAHNKCNINLNYERWKVPVIFHNFKGYDSNFIVQAMNEKITNISIIPLNTEKFMTVSFLKLQFIDSLNFLNESLDTLVENLKKSNGVDSFKVLQQEYKHCTKEQIALLLRKGVYPYEYMDSFDRFNETSLPPKEKFYSTLKLQEISDKDYDHALNVWKSFNMKTMRDYHDLYLKLDVILLADVWCNFRSICLNNDGLEPSTFVSLPSYSLNNLLRRKQIQNPSFKIELFNKEQSDMYMFSESGIRGGISTITNRYAQANNKYMKDYDSSKPTSFIKYLDANNLYGYAMSEYLPIGNYHWDTSIDKFTSEYISTISDTNDTGYIIEVDLEYPSDLHDVHNDYPLAPENLVVTGDMLSEYNTKFLKEKELKHTNCGKLIPHLGMRTNYICHYRNLKLYLSLGMILKKVHKVLAFTQSPWMKEYIDINTSKRAVANNKFEKDYYKLLNNSVFGKMMENVRNRIDYSLINVSEEKKLQKMWNCPSFKSQRHINKDILGVERFNKKVELNKPIIVGLCILDISKILMYDFHYNKMKPMYGDKIKLLFTDTDSLCYNIQTEDFYRDMLPNKNLFDNSEYEQSHIFFDDSNKKVIGKFKDETSGDEITEFIGLRSKMYSFMTNSMENEKRAKGISKAVVKNTITHQSYKDCIVNSTQMNVEVCSFRTSNHTIYTNKINKIGLSSYDDKRYIQPNGLDTYAYGHFKIQN